MSRFRLLLSSIAGTVLFASAIAHAPAHADVKTGAEAWARGDYAGAIKQWEGPAAQGDADAEFNLGQAYKLGRGVVRDLAKAELLFGKAAARGHVAAADNYGLLLFDRGERARAMPYVRAAADRGDPRAQYLLGIAHFNGDLAPKDWIRAYALMTLAQSANLPQAAPALAQMDQHIPLAQRQAAVPLATQLAHKADASSSTQAAAADLGVRPAAAGSASTPATSSVTLPPVTRPPATPPIVRPDAAVPSALRTAGGDSPATAGADYARPAVVAKPAPARKPAPAPEPKPAPVAQPAPASASVTKPAAAPKPATASGSWRIQFGAFGVPANADTLWSKVRARPELAGHPRINARSGKVTKLQAGGYASRDAAGAACASLGKAGMTCIPAQD